MRTERLWMLPVIAYVALFGATATSMAQFAYGADPAQPGQQAPLGQYGDESSFYTPGPAPGAAPAGYAMPIPYGPAMLPADVNYPVMSQAAPSQAMSPQPFPQGPYPGPEFGGTMEGYYGPGQPYAGCPSCGGYGCPNCSGKRWHDFDFNILRWLLPYGEGGCCAPRWYDIQADAILLQREDVSRFVPFTSDGINGDIILSTDNLEFNERVGFRVSGAVQILPGGSIEAGYMGTYNWATAAQATPTFPNDLFSVFSQFGTAPFNGFGDTDQAFLHTIEYSSGFDTIELNFRRRWSGVNCRFQGSWLAGVRYLKLDEQFIHQTYTTNPGFMQYFVGTSNSMTGFQLGGDTWLCIVPGVRFGGELKAGIYGNRAETETVITTNSLGDPIREIPAEDGVSFVGEASLTATWRINYHWTFRAGYEFFYLTGVALAPENFNPVPPDVFSPPPGVNRVPFVNDEGDVFYHGGFVGFEWMW